VQRRLQNESPRIAQYYPAQKEPQSVMPALQFARREVGQIEVLRIVIGVVGE
jgi:hypothetical protein